MAKLKIDLLAQNVATLLGEPSALDCQPEDSPFPGIDSRVRILAPGILTRLLLESDPPPLSVAKPLETSATAGQDGVTEICLPKDFLRLICIKMSDWKCEVNSVISFSDPEFELQSSKWDGIKGNRSRPVALYQIREQNETLIRLFSSQPGTTLDYGWYIPIPVIDETDRIEVADELLFPLTELLVEKIKET